mmetsp:Transcript_36680/g.84391  ORF Transcript_36680/g.84391 Transcript_36680/m.84391 type:complete len:307 (+) Transcript_36680:1506-2426(+)
MEDFKSSTFLATIAFLRLSRATSLDCAALSSASYSASSLELMPTPLASWMPFSNRDVSAVSFAFVSFCLTSYFGPSSFSTFFALASSSAGTCPASAFGTSSRSLGTSTASTAMINSSVNCDLPLSSASFFLAGARCCSESPAASASWRALSSSLDDLDASATAVSLAKAASFGSTASFTTMFMPTSASILEDIDALLTAFCCSSPLREVFFLRSFGLAAAPSASACVVVFFLTSLFFFSVPATPATFSATVLASSSCSVVARCCRTKSSADLPTMATRSSSSSSFSDRAPLCFSSAATSIRLKLLA